MPSKGLSTVFAPIHVRTSTVEQNSQNIIFLAGLNFVLTFFFTARMARIRIEATSATTPPSFDGIDRKMT